MWSERSIGHCISPKISLCVCELRDRNRAAERETVLNDVCIREHLLINRRIVNVRYIIFRAKTSQKVTGYWGVV